MKISGGWRWIFSGHGLNFSSASDVSNDIGNPYGQSLKSWWINLVCIVNCIMERQKIKSKSKLQESSKLIQEQVGLLLCHSLIYCWNRLQHKICSSIAWEMAEILAVTNKAGYRSSWLKLKIFCSLDIAITHWSVTKKNFSWNGWEMAEILTVTNKAGYRSS